MVFDGWRQGWLARGEGDLDSHFAPDTTYRAALALGGLALLLLLLGAWIPGRRDVRHPAVEGRRVPVAVALGMLLVTAGAIAGWLGLAAGVLGAVLAVAASRRMAAVAGLVLSAPLLVAAVAYVARPWGSSQGWAGDWAWPQLCSVLALASVCAVVSLDLSRRASSAGRRMKGRSTTR
jgi:arabinofuranan 3-O-arabinosyltransferase